MIRLFPLGALVLSVVVLLGLTTAAAAQSGSDDWNQFRGPRVDAAVTGSGIFSHPDGFSLNVAWKKPIGSGYSGVSVGGRYVVTMYAEEQGEVMVASTGTPARQPDRPDLRALLSAAAVRAALSFRGRPAGRAAAPSGRTVFLCRSLTFAAFIRIRRRS